MPFEIVRNDITKMHVDAIVNPTNSKLFGTAGVDGAIHKIEGPRLKEETSQIGDIAPGESILTKAYNLPSANIIHTVGPVWKNGTNGEEGILKSCYKNSLELAKENRFESIAFPLISSGSYGFPKDIALTVAVSTIGEFLLFNEMTVYLVVYDRKSYQLSESLYASVDAYIDDNYIDAHILRRRGREQERTDYFLSDVDLSESISNVSHKQVNSSKKNLEDVIKHLDETFSEMLLRLIDEKGLMDPEVYKKANVTKQTFSKIRNNSKYNPTKPTILAFAIALELNLDIAKDLLLKSGYALSKSNRFDVIISYFIESENYNIYEINEVLFAYEENLLGV
ncbi:RNase III inhibitor [Petrocella atlantisensis]|uniref:RNase III inhibitor n=1 Tax=Petrocella atlantisensis TaxID=2173034 RepID=A0A3P7S3D6_9FIRM|nr:macro domain-containing protein [Petrocella atlantisensis]VDN47259.1 RNase III inhibitor [Petrocella atlantisensis]